MPPHHFNALFIQMSKDVLRFEKISRSTKKCHFNLHTHHILLSPHYYFHFCPLTHKKGKAQHLKENISLVAHLLHSYQTQKVYWSKKIRTLLPLKCIEIPTKTSIRYLVRPYLFKATLPYSSKMLVISNKILFFSQRDNIGLIFSFYIMVTTSTGIPPLEKVLSPSFVGGSKFQFQNLAK